ncbi:MULTISPECIES: MoxR family ATPase [Pseudoxanthomonas]|jgi:MoxR-like ATPase|uniref:AAA family ATPase n=1 Tax=Pseudoxanthomonas TaxID=83618 RepID=UPI00161E7F20|nr:MULTISPECIES: MoxR family ATPase [Pseudoxanthomonas]MBB3277925.1 MoxR-like ATPase [Pseudoxanthomonas sp. OG2]MBD9375847.1 MoxR family ATPase [Pseudoxanthomonas sp. PXM04]MBV7474595.1 MoxR family ATPase [Pseudoxanthomonas sp. PXM05]UBB25857.1 MoxR family ATPase [Pseudoxanthomonas japonensis]
MENSASAPLPPPEQGRLHAAFTALRQDLSDTIVGQAALIERLLIALLADGHLLVEGAPGLAKTTAVRALAGRLEADFARVQFTPDLLPADLTGTEVWRPQDGRFEFQPGPIFHPLLLADEINRAPAKVQSALLEAMGERQVTVGRHTYPLPALFLVMATQNPIEQEGTFPLPEAQLDRFLMHVRIGYPEASAEAEILRLARERAQQTLKPVPATLTRMPQEDVFAARKAVLDLHVAPQLERYLIELVLASRDAARYDPKLARRIAWGASPRGSIALERCARARAWLAGRDYVTPEDVRAIAPDVLRHRVLPSYEATAEGWDGDRLVAALLDIVPLP